MPYRRRHDHSEILKQAEAMAGSGIGERYTYRTFQLGEPWHTLIRIDVAITGKGYPFLMGVLCQMPADYLRGEVVEHFSAIDIGVASTHPVDMITGHAVQGFDRNAMVDSFADQSAIGVFTQRVDLVPGILGFEKDVQLRWHFLRSKEVIQHALMHIRL